MTPALTDLPGRRHAEAPRAPGLRFDTVATSRPSAERPPHGVPLFVGFGVSRREAGRRVRAALEVDSIEQFEACMSPPDGSYLGAAVKGFFANGGGLCAVLPVPASLGAAGLRQVFAEGGAADHAEGVDLVCVPDAVSALADAVSTLSDTQAAMLAHCERHGGRLALLDAAQSPDGPGHDTLRAQAARHRSPYGALYAPWLHVGVQAGDGRPWPVLSAAVPPCGHVAGVMARTDARIGVFKAPANESLDGALAAEWDLSDAEHAALNDAGANCIRSAHGRGLRVWGARTLSGHGDWRYVPVARVFLALNRWLRQHMDEVVFEAHTPDLWQRVERRVGAYCMDLLGAGALAGSDPSRAFYVKCDAELNPLASRDAGRLVAEVGLAIAVPAEFVVVRIVHQDGGMVLTPA